MRATSRTRLRRSTLIKLTVFVTVTTVLTTFISLQIQRFSFAGGYAVSATFDDVSGLRPGDQVKIAGAPVGRVDGIKVVAGRGRVDFTVNDGIKVPTDSQAVIRWRDSLGRRVVYLVPGSATTMIKSGTRLPTTRSAVNTDDLIEALAPLTRSLNVDQVNKLLVSLAQALEGNTGEVTGLIKNVDVLLTTVASRRKNIGLLLEDYATVTQMVASRDRQIGKAIDDLVSLGDAFSANRSLIDATLVELARLARTSDAVLGKNAAELGSVLDRLSVITGGVRRNVPTLSKILTDAGPKLEHIFATVDDGRFINVAVPCITLVAPPCPYPVKLPGPTVHGAGRIASPPSYQQLILGGEGP
ncbi:MCE family protein [Actinocorallia longicatena]|uniref:Phospholipid/cholesterol/gamma-HCH transport system substrate-binding protein n=1 Tax=Actinocorallia longicatena TaxID=111803 RepID=A0ABP6QJQ7_9ACTN